MSLLSLGGFLGDAIADIWMSIWLSLNDFVYSIISVLYQVFESVANVNLFSEEVFKDITSRIYIVMGIAMLFIFAYNLILMIINPEDKKSTGQTTKVVKETIISLVLVILLPTIFNYMSIFQKHILESQIISQIILGDTGGTSAEECDYSQYTIFDEYNIGNVEDTSFLNWKTILSLGIYQIYLSTKDSTPTVMLTQYCEYYSEKLSPSQRGAYSLPATIFSAFFHPTTVDYNSCEEWIETCKDDKNCNTTDVTNEEDKEMCAYYVYDVKLAKYMGNIAPFNGESKFYSKVKKDDGTFEFNGLMALAAGVLALYMFVCYTIAIGVRVAKLGFLQLISPIAVMMRIIPKQKEAMFDKWFKHLLNTYLDVFIRLIIIYFSLFAISLVPDVIDALFDTIEGSWYAAALSCVVVILGILQFAQKAPELFKEFFGSSGNFALKSPKKQWEENKLAQKSLGAVTGAIGSGVVGGFRNFKKTDGNGLQKGLSSAGGVVGGLFRGGYSGYKNGVEKTGSTVSAVADKLEVNRDKHRATRSTIKNGGLGNYIKSDLKERKKNFTDFLFGNVASTELGNAANQIMVDVDNMENDFSNANISNIKAGRSEIMKKFNADEEFDFNGNHYRKIDANNWQDNFNNTISSEELGKKITNSFKDRLAKAYAQNEAKDGIIEGFKRANEGMLKDLRESMPKMGDEFSEKLFEKLNNLKDANGLDMNLNVNSLDDLEERMKNLMQSEDGLASIYKINDEIKSMAKGMKISNDQALKQQQAQKEKKDK